MYFEKSMVWIYRDTHSTTRRSSWYNWSKTLLSCIIKKCQLPVRFKGHRGSSKPRDFYFLSQYVTTWRFERIVKKCISLKCVVHLCGAMGVAPIYQSAGLEFEYLKGFYFHEQYLSFKNCYFFPKIWFFFCHFQVEHMLETHIFM